MVLILIFFPEILQIFVFVMSSQDLTEEQAKFLAECEAEFADRYTPADRGRLELLLTLVFRTDCSS